MAGSRLVDGTIRRRIGSHTPFVHELLRHLERCGFEGAPRVLGIDGDDEVLSYIDGHVPVETDFDNIQEIVFSDHGVRSAFALIRRYHDLTASCDLAAEQEVVCHGDLSPWNTVYGPRGAVAFIDWDNAAPGSRGADVGHAVWRHLMLGFSGAPPLEVQRRQLRIVAETYGEWEPRALLDLVTDAQGNQWDAFQHAIAERDPHILRVVELGALDHIRTAQRWVAEHRRALSS